MSAPITGAFAVLVPALAVQQAPEPMGLSPWLGTLEIVFLALWGVLSIAYWNAYRVSREPESPVGAALKVGGLLAFVYLVISGFDWLSQEVPPEQVITFGLMDPPAVAGPRVPLLADAFFWFVLALVLLVIWHARRKVGTVGGVILSAWDRGHWYMLPVIFILLTVGLLLVAAAASPVLSPFIYTLF